MPDDNGLAALTARVREALIAAEHDPAEWLDRGDLGDFIAAAILAGGAVFLPDGLPSVPLEGLLEDFDGAPYPEDFQRAVAVREADHLATIAALRAALDGLRGDLSDLWFAAQTDEATAAFSAALDLVDAALAKAKEADHA